MRIITNKPDASALEAGIEIDYSKTKGGDNSASVEGFVNIPIIEDELAVRFTYYNDRQGGLLIMYITLSQLTHLLTPTLTLTFLITVISLRD